LILSPCCVTEWSTSLEKTQNLVCWWWVDVGRNIHTIEKSIEALEYRKEWGGSSSIYWENYKHLISLEAFASTEFIEMFSGSQPCPDVTCFPNVSGTDQSIKRRRTVTSWRGWLRENIH
jgi:hypothetical protein